MTGDGVVGQLAHAVAVAPRGEVLEGADADVAGRHARQHGAWQHALPNHALAGRHGRQRARGGDAHRVHGFADHILAQHRPDRRLAVAAAREGRLPGALERDVAPLAVPVDHFAQQERAAVAQLRHEAAELVTGVGLRQGRGALGQVVTGKDGGKALVVQAVQAESQLLGQGAVQAEQLRLRRDGGQARYVEALQFAGVGVVEGEHESC